MTTQIFVPFTASDDAVVLNVSRVFGPPAELITDDTMRRDPVLYAASREFLDNGVTSGVVTVEARVS